jgi:prepilin-type N-terminal cleavage/methylation domain-containing protein
MSRERRAEAGFTLIELMMVVAIIGILASVALPSFQNFTMRSRGAERSLVVDAIHKGTESYFAARDALPGGFTWGNWNPYPGFGPAPGRKMAFRNKDAGWNLLDAEIEGTTYYTYMFQLWDQPGTRWLFVWTRGDVDGDGVPVDRQIWYNGDRDRTFRFWSQWPLPGTDVNVF